MTKWTLIGVLSALVLIVVGIVMIRLRPHDFHGMVIQSPEAAPDFTLQTADGDFTLSQQEGKAVVVFFGYTHCPDVCPTTLFEVKQAMEIMGPKADNVQVVFVSVDAERDTPEQVNTYASNFDPRFIGVTGDRLTVNAVATQYGIFYQSHEADERGDYAVDHTASLAVIDRAGHLKLILPPDVTAEAIAADLTEVLRR